MHKLRWLGQSEGCGVYLRWWVFPKSDNALLPGGGRGCKVWPPSGLMRLRRDNTFSGRVLLVSLPITVDLEPPRFPIPSRIGSTCRGGSVIKEVKK